MVPPEDLSDRIRHTVEQLPYEKQQEVYDFAEYLRNRTKSAARKQSALADLIGCSEGPEDMAATHDSIYD